MRNDQELGAAFGLILQRLYGSDIGQCFGRKLMLSEARCRFVLTLLHVHCGQLECRNERQRSMPYELKEVIQADMLNAQLGNYLAGYVTRRCSDSGEGRV